MVLHDLTAQELQKKKQKKQKNSLFWKKEKAMATHSSILAWRTPWTEEPGELQSMGSLRVGHDWATSLSLFLSYIREGNGNPLQWSCLENPRDGGAWWAAVRGVAQSRTRLKWLSSSSSSSDGCLGPEVGCVMIWENWETHMRISCFTKNNV